MIITRSKNAQPLHNLSSPKKNELYYTNAVLYSAKAGIIYSDNGLHFHSYTQDQLEVYKKVQSLEERNIPFILLINSKCDMNISKNFATFTHVDSVKYTKFQEYLPAISDVTTESKSKLIDKLFINFFEVDNKAINFVEDFPYFVQHTAQAGLLNNDCLFIAFDTKTGEIHNANFTIGKFYDSEKIWYCNEEYNDKYIQVEPVTPHKNTSTNKFLTLYAEAKKKKEARALPPATVITSNKMTVDEFFKFYESGEVVKRYNLSHFTQEELVRIITKYPTLFSDLTRKTFSYCKKDYIEYIANHPDEFELEENKDFLDIVREYTPEEFDAPTDCAMCVFCENYYPHDQLEDVYLTHKPDYACQDCNHMWLATVKNKKDKKNRSGNHLY